MPSLKAIKTKIKSTGNLKKISRALEVISTIKLQKNKAKVESAKQYFLDLTQLISEISDKIDLYQHQKSDNGRKLIIVVTSEKGLCGGLNTKITKLLSNNYPVDTTNNNTDVFILGKKGFEYCKRAGYNIVGYLNLKDEIQQSDLQPLFLFLQEQSTGYASVDIVFNYFNNVLTQIASAFTLYPLSKQSIQGFLEQVGVGLDNQKLSNHKGFEIIEPSLEQVRTELQKQIISYIITATVLQNKLAEHAGRMIAMKGAKDNCTKVIGSLTLQFNKLRQANITKEISEITAAKIAME